MKLKTTFKTLAREYTGRIILMTYANRSKTLAFSPVEPVESSMGCNCGYHYYNATNFGNLVHFCPDRELEVEVTDFIAVKH